MSTGRKQGREQGRQLCPPHSLLVMALMTTARAAEENKERGRGVGWRKTTAEPGSGLHFKWQPEQNRRAERAGRAERAERDRAQCSEFHVPCAMVP